MAGQLIKRGENTWVVRVYAGLENGKRRYINKTVHGTKKEGQSVLNKMLVDRDTHQLVAPTRVTLSDYLEDWKAAALKGRVSPRTFDGYGEALRRDILPKLGAKRLTSLSARDIQVVYADMLDRGLSGATVRYAHAVLRNALRQAVRWGYLASNPADSVDLPKGGSSKKHTVIRVDQVEAFLTAAASSPWKAVYHLLLNTGLRPGEAFGLAWDNVDLVACELTVRQAVTFDYGKAPIIGPTKTKKNRRVTFTNELATVLVNHKDATMHISNPLGLVFTTIDGGLIHPNNWSKQDFKSVLARAGLLKSVRLYDLRHSMATIAMGAGVNPKIVSERLGHATIKLTMDTYSHVTPHMQDEAGDQIAAAIYRTNKDAPREPAN